MKIVLRIAAPYVAFAAPVIDKVVEAGSYEAYTGEPITSTSIEKNKLAYRSLLSAGYYIANIKMAVHELLGNAKKEEARQKEMFGFFMKVAEKFLPIPLKEVWEAVEKHTSDSAKDVAEWAAGKMMGKLEEDATSHSEVEAAAKKKLEAFRDLSQLVKTICGRLVLLEGANSCESLARADFADMGLEYLFTSAFVEEQTVVHVTRPTGNVAAKLKAKVLAKKH